jgi:hypothetical protein
MDIQLEHMQNRCYFISAMCGLSLYGWCNYSLFEPLDNSFFTPYYQNCLLMLFYLGWDTYQMFRRSVLFRTDLMIHHCITLVVYLSYINLIPLQMSNILIMECISLMNYAWKNNPRLLKLYRTVCIFCIRMPVSLWFWLYYNPNFTFPEWNITHSRYSYVYLHTLGNIFAFFIVYDVFILWKLYTPLHLKSAKV